MYNPPIMSRPRGIEIDNQVILIAVVVATLLLLPLVAFTTGGFRIAFGILFALFLPGIMNLLK
jgi:5-formyltetrahydrofolate cyclo-ligase